MSDSAFKNWHGRLPCPLGPGFRVRVRYRGYPDRKDDTIIDSGMYPKSGWIHNQTHRDIVKYYVV